MTGTVLGYGDITPLNDALKLLTVVESGLGFALLTGIVSYLVNVVSGVHVRNAAATRLHTDTGEAGDGAQLILRRPF